MWRNPFRTSTNSTMSASSLDNNPYHVPDDVDIEVPARPSHLQQLHALHTRETSLGDPISIYIQTPSTANLSPRSETPPQPSPFLVPSRPPSLAESESNAASHNTPSGLAAQQEEQTGPHVVHTPPRPIIEDLSSSSSRQGAKSSTQQQAYFSSFADGPTIRPAFTAVDPFARRKHRLSWSSILPAKGPKRENPPDAWTTPVEEDPRNDAESMEVIYDWASFEDVEHPVNPHTGSSRDSTATSTSSYHSFDQEKEKPRKTATFEAAPVADRPDPLPEDHKKYPASSLRFSRQPTEVKYYPPPDSDEPLPISLFGLIYSYLSISRLYLYFLLGVPGLYFTRVATVFEDANIHGHALEQMVLNNASARRYPELVVSYDHPAFKRLNKSWTQFIDTLIKEWKTFNIISVLLLSAIVAILQIEPAFNDPIVHYAALFSLVSALMNLMFGCMYILRFNTMRAPHKAVQWARETQKTHTNLFWNVWILLAIPAVWLVWSLIFYIVAIMAFVWRVESGDPPPAFSPQLVLAIRIGISTALAVGLTYIVVVMVTFVDFGAPMDKRFREKLKQHVQKNYAGSMKLRRSDTFNSRAPPAKEVPQEWFASLPHPYAGSNNSLYRMSGMSIGSKFSFNAAVDIAPAPPVVADPLATRQKDTQVHFRSSTQDSIVPPTVLPQMAPSPLALHEPLVMHNDSRDSGILNPQATFSAPVLSTNTLSRPPAPRRSSTKPQPARRLLLPQVLPTTLSHSSFDEMRVMEEAHPPNPAVDFKSEVPTPSTRPQPSPQIPDTGDPPPQQTATVPRILIRIPREAIEAGKAQDPISHQTSPHFVSTHMPDTTLPTTRTSHPEPPPVVDSDGPLFFGPTTKPPYDCLVMHSPHPVEYQGFVYPSSAHALEAHGGHEDRHSGTTIEAIQLAKFLQNPAIAQVLLLTGDRELIYLDRNGSATKNGGMKLGEALMAVRKELKRLNEDGT